MTNPPHIETLVFDPVPGKIRFYVNGLPQREWDGHHLPKRLRKRWRMERQKGQQA